MRLDDRLDDAYFLKGRLYLETGTPSQAASSFQTVVEVEPLPLRCLHPIGLLYAAAHEDLALEYFKTAAQLKPNSIEAFMTKPVYLKSMEMTKARRYADALDLV